MDFLNRILPLFRELHRHEVDYVLVGGAAVNIHGRVRSTEDVDLFIRVEPENVARLRRALRAVWDDESIEEITYEDLIEDYPTIRYGPPEDDLIVDILTRLGTAFRFEDLEAETRDVHGIPVQVATPATLYRMKKGTVRPVDWGDAAALREMFDLEDDD